MKLDALLDVNVVAHETTDEVAVLLDLEAPAVASDDEAQLVVATGPLSDKAAVIAEILSVEAGGLTDLGAGYLRGLRELSRVLGTGGPGGTLLVISDGHVNSGVTDVDQFASMTAKAHSDGVVTSTLGYGHGYDETLLAAIARSGSGNQVFAADPDAAGAAIAREVDGLLDGLLDKVVQAATLTVHFEPTVHMLRLYNDLPARQLADGRVMVELGDLYSSEQRKLLMRFQVPAVASLGLAQVATLELQYVELPGLVEQTVKLPISVNVAPGDEAAHRIPDPSVRSEALFQQAQDLKKRASEACERGDLDAGRLLLGRTDAVLDDALSMAPVTVVDSIRAEKDQVVRMVQMTENVGSTHMSKLTLESHHRQNRKRGR